MGWVRSDETDHSGKREIKLTFRNDEQEEEKAILGQAIIQILPNGEPLVHKWVSSWLKDYQKATMHKILDHRTDLELDILTRA